MNERQLLRVLTREYPAQPATAVWRAAELAAVLRFPFPTGRGLDLGCGDGKLTRIVLDAVGGRRLVGVDPDPQETALARASGIYEQVHTASASVLPEASGSFDFAFSNSVLEHIPDLAPVIAETARVLKPGGSFVFTVPSLGFHDLLFGPIAPWARRSHYLAEVDRRLAHMRYPSREEWRAMLGQHGIALVECHPYLSRAWVQRWELISRSTAGALVTLTGGRLRPIEIQRKLSVRRHALRWPEPIATSLAALLAAGLPSDVSQADASERDHGGLLIFGLKRS